VSGQSSSVKLPRFNRRLFIALLLFIAGLCLFFSIYNSLHTGGGIAQFDDAVQQLTARYSHPVLTTTMHVITNLLAPFTLGIVTIVGAIIWIKHTKELWRPGLLATGMGMAYATSFIVKSLTGRTRPSSTSSILPFESSYSFPSGHVLALTTFVLVLGYLLYSRAPSRKYLTIWISSAVGGIILIAFSRLYLDFHWLTDVSASVGLALTILAVIMTIDYFKPQLKHGTQLFSYKR